MAIAVRAKGVLGGMVTLLAFVLLIVGALFVSGVVTGQVCPLPVIKDPISCRLTPWKWSSLLLCTFGEQIPA